VLTQFYQYSREIKCNFNAFLSSFSAERASKNSGYKISDFNATVSLDLEFKLSIAKLSHRSIIIASFYEKIRFTGNLKALKGFQTLLNSILSRKDSGLLNSFLKLDKLFPSHKGKILSIFEIAREIEKLRKKFVDLWVKNLFRVLDSAGIEEAAQFAKKSLEFLRKQVKPLDKILMEEFSDMLLKLNNKGEHNRYQYCQHKSMNKGYQCEFRAS